MGLLTRGKYPTLLLIDIKHEKDLLEAMKEKFHIVRGVHRLDVPSICYPTVQFAT
jgi:hypothetical protein